MTIPHRLFLLGFERATIFQRLCGHPFVGRGIDGMNLVSGDYLPTTLLTAAEHLLQIFIDFTMHQRIIDTAKFSPEQR